MTEQRRAFLEARQQGIGASDAAAVLNLSPWGTPLSVYQSKVEPIEEEVSGSLPAWLGLRLEDVVAELFTARTGIRTRRDNLLHVHPEDPWMVAHTDYRALGDPSSLVECKTQSYRAGWGDDEDTEDVPVHYWIQAQHEMFVTGATVCHVPVLFGLQEFRSYTVPRNDEFLETWRQAASEFWHTYVVPRIPPPLEGDSFSKRLVRARWPEHDGTLKMLPPERELLVLRLRDEMGKLKEQDNVVETLKHRIEDLIGDAAGIEGPWGKITWKQTKDKVIVEWEQVAETYRAAIGNVLDNVNPGDDEQAVQALALAQSARDAAVPMFTRVEPGYRRIDVRFRKEES
jgi:putative phage-type endonuclease